MTLTELLQQLLFTCCTDLRNGWQIISPSKSFTVYAATASEKSEWMAHISKCAEDLITKRKLNNSYLEMEVVMCFFSKKNA